MKKKEIMTFINLEIELYLLPDRYLNSSFLKKVLNGQKKLIKRKNIIFVKRVLNFKELKLKNIIDSYPKKRILLDHLPDFDNLARLHKPFVLNICNTIVPNYFDDALSRLIEEKKY